MSHKNAVAKNNNRVLGSRAIYRLRFMKNFFGTDGIRASVDDARMSPLFVLRLGWAFGMTLNDRGISGSVLIAKDTRLSGYMLESALESGLSASGRDIKLLGPLPTPAVAFLLKTTQSAGAIVISASHNPFHHNGLKLFNELGEKIDAPFELEIEKWNEKEFYLPDPSNLGKAGRVVDAVERYIGHLVDSQTHVFNLSGMRLVFDGANGAAYRVGPMLLQRLNAEVHTNACSPDGLNINKNCGSTDVRQLREKVLQLRAHFGIATDGDADRLFMVDHLGQVYDGDKLLYALFKMQLKEGNFSGGLVGTVQSNYGLEKTVQAHDVPFIRTKVGDRYVLQELRQRDWQLGGESSGHLINRQLTECSDGLMIAICLLGYLKESGLSLAELIEDLRIMPATQINYPSKWLGSEEELLQTPALKTYLEDIDNNLHRVVIRPSGTEPVVRILIEGECEKDNKTHAESIAKIVGQIIAS